MGYRSGGEAATAPEHAAAQEKDPEGEHASNLKEGNGGNDGTLKKPGRQAKTRHCEADV